MSSCAGFSSGVLTGSGIRFDRRSPEPNAVFLEDKSPVAHEVWTPEPRADTKTVGWCVKELGKTLTSAELAAQVAIRLVKQYEAYEHAFGR